MAKKRKQAMQSDAQDDDENGWVEEATPEPEWHTPDVLPPQGARIEMDSAGELLTGCYDGVWRPDGSIRGVNVQRWRLA